MSHAGALSLLAVLIQLGIALSSPGDSLSAEDYSDHFTRWAATAAAAESEDPAGAKPFMPPLVASEWYTVTIANVSVGYMHTTTAEQIENATVQTMEVMDVTVSRGSDKSRMAFETVFTERGLDAADAAALDENYQLQGGVTSMAYDQRFANNEVKMTASFSEAAVTLVSYNGNAEHTSNLELPEVAWLGRLRARLAFTAQCKLAAPQIVIQTMRPELGPRVVNLSYTFVSLDEVFDGEEMVEASIWTVQISDVPVNMTEAYPTRGPLRCYRMLQMGLDMPFGYLLASLSSEEEAIAASKDDPNRVLPELVYTMFVPLPKPIKDVYNARMVRLSVSLKAGKKGSNELFLPSAGYQLVTPVNNDVGRLTVKIDLQAPLAATASELSDNEFTSPSAMVDSSDEVVVALSHSGDETLRREGFAIPPQGEPVPTNMLNELAHMLRDVVHNHISDKHLSTAYASASETARTASGDCTEHAVLLAAVLKARGIPARVCHGLVYIEQGGSAINGQAEVDANGNVMNVDQAPLSGQFGWHMWSQAMINGRWIDLDATLHVPYTVGHVLVGTSSMSDKEAHNNHMQMAALIGNLEMKVLTVSHKWN